MNRDEQWWRSRVGRPSRDVLQGWEMKEVGQAAWDCQKSGRMPERSKKQEARSKEPGARSQEQGARSQEQGTRNKQQAADADADADADVRRRLPLFFPTGKQLASLCNEKGRGGCR